MREEVQKLVEVNRKKVEQVFEQGGSLIDAALLAAPKPVQEAIGRILENKEVMALLIKNEQLIRLLGENVEEGIKQITSGNAEGGLVVVSPQNQIAALETILAELSKNEKLSPQDIQLAGGFLRTVVAMDKAAKQLLRGEKEYITCVTEVDGHIKVMHISCNDIDRDRTTIGRIFSTFMEQGVTQNLHVQLTSRQEAAAISVVMNNVDVKGLTGRMGELSNEQLRSLTQGSMDGALVKSGAELTSVQTIPQIVDLIARSAQNVDALAFALENPELGKQLTEVMSELKLHYANKPSTAYTEEQVFTIMTELLTMQLAAQQFQRIFRMPENSPNLGPIGLFVNSPLFPSSSPGNLLMIMDSSLKNDPTGQQLMLGTVPSTLQLTDSHDVPSVHVILPPTDLSEIPPPLQHTEEEARLNQIKQDEAFASEEQAKELASAVVEKMVKEHVKQQDEVLALQEQAKEMVSLVVEVATKELQKNAAIIKRVDRILDNLVGKVHEIGNDHPEANLEAIELYENLVQARNNLEDQLAAGGDREQAQAEFKEWCGELVSVALPILEKDLGWGEYLENMLKSIANVFIAGAQKLGSTATFFNTSSKSAQSVAATGQDLQADAGAEEEEGHTPPM